MNTPIDYDDGQSPFDAEVGVVICPSCGTEQYHHESHLGNLGVIEHHRCRFCGWDFQYRPSKEETNDNR